MHVIGVEPMADGIFISYRRSDTADTAGRLSTQLRTSFGQGSVFMDVQTTEQGRDIVDGIRSIVSQCSVMLVLIGPNWLNAKNVMGQRLIDHPSDIVRLEIATAISTGIVIIPVMVDGALFPSISELAVDIADLGRSQALFIRRDLISSDIQRIEAAVRTIVEAARSTDRSAGRLHRRPSLVRPKGRKVFVSYRRSDTTHIAGRICDKLTSEFTSDDVFFDVDTIPVGVNFKKHIGGSLGATCLVVAVIGRRWSNKSWNSTGIWGWIARRREDYVQGEIELALDLGIPILPVLVDGAPMPVRERLPDRMVDICSLNAATVRGGRDFHRDMAAVIEIAKQRREEYAGNVLS